MDNVRRTSGLGRRWPSLNPLSSASGRIILGFGLLVVILVAVAFGSALQVRKHQSDTAAMQEHADTAFLIQDALVNVETAASALQRYVTVGDETLVAGDEVLIAQIRDYAAAGRDAILQATAQEEKRRNEFEVARLQLLSSQAASLIVGMEQIIELRRSGGTQEAAAALEGTVFPFRLFEDSLREAAEYQAEELSDLRGRADRAGDIALWLLVISGAAGAVLGLTASGLIARSIIKPLSSLEATAVAVSNGDLGARAQAAGPRELARLGASLNAMTESLLDASKRRELENALQESEERLRSIFDATWEGICVHENGVILDANPASEKMVGYPLSELIGKSVLDLATEESRDLIAKKFRSGGQEPYEAVALRKDGTTFSVELMGKEHAYMGREVRVVALRDITERKRAEEALRETERLLLESQSVAQIGSYFLDIPSGVWESSPVLDRIFGIGEDFERSVEGWLALVHPDVRQSLADYFAHDVVEEHGRFDIEYRIVRHDDEIERWVLGLGELEFDARGQPLRMIGTIQDITERKRGEAMIERLAYHDALTGLPNRALFADRLNLALAQAGRNKQPVAVMFLDLDHFKVVNDTVGHAAGDQLLRSAAERLTGLVREGDTVARMGGDEFTVLLPDVAGVEDATEVARRVIEVCRRPWEIDEQEFHVTASIGIAIYPNDGEDAEGLIRNADTAMYRAKEQGRDNCQLFTAAMNATVVERLALENSLRHGLERGEFVVHYQPLVDISSGRMVGTEALVRWQRPEHGLVSPMEFIPAAEEIGLIVPLGVWVLQTACAQNVAWQQAGHAPMPVAVNLSARQFQQRDLLDTVTQVLEESGMDPKHLQLEITEGVAMQDVESTATTLGALRAIGVQIAIDDFGTGHSSLSYLKAFPVSALKIDRSFVRDLTADPDDAAITAAILAMAKSLRIKVIAEGVETEEQLAFLKEHGCDEMQGFLFSKPVPARTLEKMLAPGSLPPALARRPG